ncbi:peptide chain release factor N(5)-glutamine methyltransferase [Mangrovicoccus algicola]|uniref:Release factor glutamine methyltransferase n=1 Tax=Mangrovicoccus algicola TaxID=2771008 RepID=A0A8J6Z6K0_9RHOB|nr:peptide chain release factor N(5)-glutamine methyltransferase [Mangrovicoccus algicola]MBE3637136.1 peptide chain release factor N(5)-glutamine methyltransferase [Mangrovicoccus algicola]
MSPTVGAAMRAAIARLAAAGVADPARDVRRLAAEALGLTPSRLVLAERDPWPEGAEARFRAMLDARAARQPVAQILGRRDFFGRRFRVTPDVLDPRPETEALILEALRQPAARILDIGTGSGCILLTLLAEWPDATGVATDASAAALDVARGNAASLGLAGRAAFRLGDWTAGAEGPFDLIVSNPPYIAEAELAALAPDVTRWEPAMALSPGIDGLAAYRAILPQAFARLSGGGRLLLEIGAAQGPDVADLCAGAGFSAIRILPDLDGRDRVVAAIRP